MHGGEPQFVKIWYMNQGQDSVSVNLNLSFFFKFLSLNHTALALAIRNKGPICSVWFNATQLVGKMSHAHLALITEKALVSSTKLFLWLLTFNYY